MGQSQSNYKDLIPDVVQVQLMKHQKIFSELGNLDYDEFQRCLHELNELSRKCIDASGNQMVFAVKKGSDKTPLLWKATIRIACVKVDPQTKKIADYKLINLKQFLQIFNNFQNHINAMSVSEDKQRSNNSSCNNSPTAAAGRHRLDVSYLMNQLHNTDKVFNFDDCDVEVDGGASSSTAGEECSICLDRKPEIILPCSHFYCTPCITQWNLTNKSCPICMEELSDTSEGWVISEMPDAQEVNEEIYAILTSLSKGDKKE